MKGKIYLIPNKLSDSSNTSVIPESVRSIAIGISHFVVENEKVSRRYLKKLDRNINIDELTFYAMGKHSDSSPISEAIGAARSGHDIGVISDAGCPGVADPGSYLVGLAHQAGLEVVPLVGPSSILLTLMASGLNGQRFAFHGYLPKERTDRSREIKRMVQRIFKENSTQLFMDTPFRNMNLLEDLLRDCPNEMLLCIARDITGEKEEIRTRSIAEWKRSQIDLHKIPVMFALGH